MSTPFCRPTPVRWNLKQYPTYYVYIEASNGLWRWHKRTMTLASKVFDYVKLTSKRNENEQKLISTPFVLWFRYFRSPTNPAWKRFLDHMVRLVQMGLDDYSCNTSTWYCKLWRPRAVPMVFWSGIAAGRRFGGWWMEEPCFSSQILSNFLGAQIADEVEVKKKAVVTRGPKWGHCQKLLPVWS